MLFSDIGEIQAKLFWFKKVKQESNSFYTKTKYLNYTNNLSPKIKLQY